MPELMALQAHPSASLSAGIPAMGAEAIARVRQVETIARGLPQVRIHTDHVIHGGMYARTVTVPAGVMITGVLIRVATLLVVHGDAIVYVGDEALHLSGYTVLPASAGRKQAFVALSDVHLTMVFPTSARTVAAAERQFTDEADLLTSRLDVGSNSIRITEE